MTNKPKPDFEFLKLSFDWCKHVSTLSTGSILLMVTFLEKLSQQPRMKYLLVVALIFFVLSILASFLIQLDHMAEQTLNSNSKLGFVSGIVMVIAFPTGMVCLTVFAVRNLL